MTWQEAVAPKEQTSRVAPTPIRRTNGAAHPYAQAALDAICADLAATPEGTRNDTLNAGAYRMGGFVAGGHIDDHQVCEALSAAGRAAGLDASETAKTISSGIEAVKAEPKHPPATVSRATARAVSTQAPKSLTPADVVVSWAQAGPLARVATGIAPLDEACRGGLPIPWRVVIVGAPSAGKTAASTVIADHLARAASASLCVGILAIDEDPDDITVRLAQLAGFSVAQAEQRDPEVLRGMAEALRPLRLRLFDSTHTIESAATDLAAWAALEGRKGALFIDSIQTANHDGADPDATPREYVEGNMRAIRFVSTHHRMLVVTTSEANRSSYRSADAAETGNDLAAGAESRAVEFGAQTQLMLRTPKDHPDVIHVRVAKNRRAHRCEFWLKLDREGHTLRPCPDPTADPNAAAEQREERKAAVRATVVRDTEALAALLVRHPQGLGVRELRAELKATGHAWGVERIDAAKVLLRGGHKGVRLIESDSGNGRRTVSRVVSDAGPGGDDA